MSEDNVELVRRSYEVFNRGSVDAAFSGGFWSPEIVFDASSTGIPGLGVYRGHDEVKAVFEDWFQAFPFEEWEIEVGELRDAGDQVFAISRQRGRGASSGAGAELELANISRCATERSCGWGSNATEPKPSRPPGFRSRRCRRRTWGRSCAASTSSQRQDVEYVNPPGAIDRGIRRGRALAAGRGRFGNCDRIYIERTQPEEGRWHR